MTDDNPCHDIISLAGQLDWRFRNGKDAKDILSVITKIRRKLTQVENRVNKETKQ